MIPELSTIKLVGFAIAAAAILSFVALAFHWKSTMTDRGQQLATICAATRAAAAQPKLDCKQVPQQIGFLGQTVTALSNALKVQRAAVASLGQQSATEQAQADQAVKKAQGRAQGAEATASRLAASSRSTVPQSAPQGQFSNTLEGAWQ